MIARNKDATVAEYLDASNGSVHWIPSFNKQHMIWS